MIGVVENMGGLTLPLSDLLVNDSSNSNTSGIRLVDREGNDVTAEATRKILETIPELLNLSLTSSLFSSLSSSSSEVAVNPKTMSASFGVPYLGSLPLDLNLTRACEEGRSLLESQPLSSAAQPLRLIVEKIVQATSTK